MDYKKLLDDVFAGEVKVECANDIFTGEAVYKEKVFAVCGVVNEAGLDNMMSVSLAEFILKVIDLNDKRPICIFIDTSGQKVSRHAELLGLNYYYAHLIKTINLSRRLGHRVFALVYGKALGGAFIATGLNADYIFAIPTAQIAVMWLDAMSRVTKIPIEKLKELSKVSPIFAPGADNFVKLGAVDAIISPSEFMAKCVELLDMPASVDHKRLLGAKNGGRKLAQNVVNHIVEA